MEPIDLKGASGLAEIAGAALLEYVVMEKRTYLFVVTRGGSTKQPSLKVYRIDIEKKKLNDLVGSYRRRLALRDWSLQALSAELYNLLLRPAADQLRGETNFIIAPDGPLWELPFQALLSAPERYLIEDHAVSYVPSFTVLREMVNQRGRRNVSGNPSLLAFGNPSLGVGPSRFTSSAGEELTPLPDAERQVKTLARLNGLKLSKVYTGDEASEGRLKADAGKFRIVHLAAHGVLNNANPMYSQIVLAQTERGDRNGDDDGLLEAWEIMKLDLSADLVVLSACETGRGRIGAGEGVVGLSWALFVAGSPTTVVSQWKVASAGTTELMVEFYRQMRATNNATAPHSHGPGATLVMNKARALRLASLKLLRSTSYRDPFFWAGFVVVGDPN
jgi:CHAT domain-containing protein